MDSVIHPAFRPADTTDFEFCERLYFGGMTRIIQELGLDMTRQRAAFRSQWDATEVRIIVSAGDEVGWLQTSQSNGAMFLKQLYIAEQFRRRGIGESVVRMLIAEAEHEANALTVAVVKISPARRLYTRMGFEATHEDRDKVYMRFAQSGNSV